MWLLLHWVVQSDFCTGARFDVTAFALHRPTCEQQQRLQLSCKTLTDQCDTAAAAAAYTAAAAAAYNDGAPAA